MIIISPLHSLIFFPNRLDQLSSGRKRNFIHPCLEVKKEVDAGEVEATNGEVADTVAAVQTIEGNDFIYIHNIRIGYRGGDRAPVHPPGALRERPGGRATNWLNNCQNSLNTRLKYTRISLKVDFYI